MKKYVIALVLTFVMSQVSWGQVSISANYGLTSNQGKNFLTASSISTFSGINLTWQFNKMFVSTGVELNAFSPVINTEIQQLNLPLTLGTVYKKNNFEELIGLGYTLGLPFKFNGISEQKYATHSLRGFIEHRLYISNNSYFSLGLNINLNLKTSSPYAATPFTQSTLYFGYGFSLRKND